MERNSLECDPKGREAIDADSIITRKESARSGFMLMKSLLTKKEVGRIVLKLALFNLISKYLERNH